MDIQTKKIAIETDEDGFYLVVETQLKKFSFRIDDPEALYDQVRSAIWPWLYEKDMGRVRFHLGDHPYEITDPKHPRHHSVMSEIWDSREGK